MIEFKSMIQYSNSNSIISFCDFVGINYFNIHIRGPAILTCI